MLRFRNLRIGTKLIVASSLLVTATIVVILVDVSLSVYQITGNYIQDLAKETAHHYANAIKSDIEVSLDEARALSKIFQASAIHRQNIGLDRQKVNWILEHFIEESPYFLGVYVLFEPNAFDGKDAEFAGTPGHDSTGRFIPYWSRDQSGKGHLEPLINYEIEGPGDYYQIPKRKRRETITEPYVYPVQGQDILMTSLTVPILDEQKRFLGIAGIDLDLQSLQKLVSGKEISDFEAAYANVYSPAGVIISHTNTERIGKNVKTVNTDKTFVDYVLSNQDFVYERTADLLNETVITYGVPIEIGLTGSRWMVVVNIPKRELASKTLELIKTATVLGVVIILITIAVIYFMARSFVKPITQMNRQLKFLAQGQLDEKPFNYENRDEIAEMIDSVHQVRAGIKATIEQAKAIAAGDYSQEVKLLSEKDLLGQSLSEMIHILREVVQQANAISVGDYSKEIKILSKRDQLGQALSQMTTKLRDMTAKNAEQDWLKTGLAQLNEQMSGDQEIVTLAKNIISFLTSYLEAKVGLFYLLKIPSESTPKPYLELIASYAYVQRANIPDKFTVGEGLIGEVALTRKMIICDHSPEEYTYVTRSSLSQIIPRFVMLVPILYENSVKGVIELGVFDPFPTNKSDFLTQALPNIGIAVNTAESRMRMKALLEQSQRQAQELQLRQAEMQHINAELQTQAEELQTQQEELRQTNETLEHRTQDLERQKEEIRNKNSLLEKTQVEMEIARTAIEAKAKELELASKYKSEFLANMSHELRTPLNSLLILAQLLAENKENNLNAKQIEYAQTIHSAGADLLNLINDILDLSKVEAGKVEALIEEVTLVDLVKEIEQKFRPVAAEKHLAFNITVSEQLPSVLHTDGQRLKQILNNLLSNAFKFTQHGAVTLAVARPQKLEDLIASHLTPAKTIVFNVTDTGIGIPEDKCQVIFEAFQQVDGTTSRKYGGTGLGLSISRQLSKLLGGELKVTSTEGQGSIFSLYLPDVLAPQPRQELVLPKIPTTDMVPKIEPAVEKKPVPVADLSDDRDNLQPDDKCLLIIEDDRRFSRILMELAQEKGFKCLLAEDGGVGLLLADEYRPTAIILDMTLPVMGGWTVIEKLKSNPDTRHIPVHFISGSDQKNEAQKMGAIGYTLKPVGMGELAETFKRIEEVISKMLKKVLIVVDDRLRQHAMMQLLGENNVEITVVANPTEVYRQLHEFQFDCLVIDVGIGLQLLEEIQRDDALSQLPVIVYAERELTADENNALQKYTQFLAVKSVKSPARLLDEVTLFLHQVESSLSADKQKMLRSVYDKEAIFAHKKVLLVDDDSRNVFALAVTLDEKGMEVLTAENGKEALELLKQHQDIDIVLMDIMMPEMDGYETMRKIRAQPQFRRLPIMALTAKAMREDKAKCIEAGANDYLAKPVNTSKLLSLMRVWLYQ